MNEKEKLILEDFKKEIVEDVKEQILNSDVNSDLLKELIAKEIYGKIDDLNFRMSRIEQDMRTDSVSKETAHQEGLILHSEAGSKIPKIDARHMHLKDFIPKNWKERKQERELNEV